MTTTKPHVAVREHSTETSPYGTRTRYVVEVNGVYLCQFFADEDGFVTQCFMDKGNWICFDMNTKPGWTEKMEAIDRQVDAAWQARKRAKAIEQQEEAREKKKSFFQD